MDESNPFYVKKKKEAESGPAKPQFKDTSDAASDILRKMMDTAAARAELSPSPAQPSRRPRLSRHGG